MYKRQGFWSFARQQGVIAVDDARSDAVRRERHRILPGTSRDVLEDLERPDIGGPGEPGVVRRHRAARDELEDAGVEAHAAHHQVGTVGKEPAAGVGYVLTDSSCADDWRFPPDQRVVPLATEGYQQDGDDATITLWRVLP